MSITENGTPKTFASPAGPPSELIVSFGGTTSVSASAKCNTFSARYSLEGSILRVRDGATTLIGCPGGLLERDGFVFDVLSKSPSYSVQGNQLTLRSGAKVIVLIQTTT